jgi:hypothetical protein
MAEIRIGRPPTRFTNPWAELLGCEVRFCQAELCDRARLRFCALRRAWLERRGELRTHWEHARGRRAKLVYEKLLKQMGAWDGE